MTETSSGKTLKIWLISAIFGVLSFMALLWIAGYSPAASVIVGVLVTLLVAILLWMGWYDESAVEDIGHPEADVTASGLMATASVGDEPMSAAEEIAPDHHAADTRAPRSAAAATREPAAAVGQEAPSAVDDIAIEEVPVEEVSVEEAVGDDLTVQEDDDLTVQEVVVAEPVAMVQGVSEVSEPDKPAFLSAPLEGGADDLKQIKGVGPKLEALLNTMGIFHFNQIASWGASEVVWMDENLKGFKGRVTRDDWVGQARLLARGQDTEFSKRVQKGSVY